MRIATLLLISLLIGACASHPPTAPVGVQQAERYMGLGVQSFGNDDYAGASAMFAKAQAIYRSMDHLEGMVQSGIDLAETAIAIGSYARAQRQIEVTLPMAQRLGRADYLLRLNLLTAVAFDGRKQRDEALKSLQALLPGFNADNSPQSTPGAEALSAIVLRTRMAFGESDPQLQAQWIERLQRSLAGASGDNALVRARLLRFQGELARRGGDRVTARARLDQALAIYRTRASRAGTAATLDDLAAVALDDARPDEAREYLERALFIQMWILDRPGAADSLRVLRDLYAGAGDREKAAQAQQWAESLAREGEPDWKQMRLQLAPSE